MNENKNILRSSILQGFSTLIIRELLLKLFSFVGQIFLARLLFPSDFGVYVVIVFAVNLLSLFTDIGLSMAIIQKHDEPTRIELSSIFWLKISLSVVVILIIWIISPFLRQLYSAFTNDNILMVRVLALSLITANLRAIPIALLERKIKYNLISMVDVIGVITYYLVSLTSAIMHFGVWSFILGAMAKEVLETFVVYVIKPFLPAGSFSLQSIRKMLKFGIYIQGNAFVNIIYSSIIPVIGGRLTGIYSVGLLDFSYSLASIPELIAQNFGRVAFAGYSRIQKEKEILFSSISKSVNYLAIILYIFPVIILGLGGQLVPLIFSAKWAPALPALYWFSAGAFMLPIIASMGQGVLVLGKSKENFWFSFINICLGATTAILLIGLVGFIGISVAYLQITICFGIFYLYIFQREGYSLSKLISIIPKLMISIALIIILFICNNLLPSSMTILLAKLFVVVILYIMFIFMVAKQDLIELLSIIIEKISLK